MYRPTRVRLDGGPDTERTRASVNKKIDSFAEGDLTDNAKETLFALWEVVNRDGDIKAPSNILPAVSPFRPPDVIRGCLPSHDQAPQATNPANWAALMIALIKSIHEGIFFDRKYWARHSESGDVIKPVYFSSIIMGGKARKLNKRASRFGYGVPEALTVPSGKVPQGSRRSQARGRSQPRQRLRRRFRRSWR